MNPKPSLTLPGLDGKSQIKKHNFKEFSGGPVVRTQLSLQEVQVTSLV